MSNVASVSVIIPTYNRGTKIVETLQRLSASVPAPGEIIVHIDASDGSLERCIRDLFPNVVIISSAERVGPGGGRDRCLKRCSFPFAVSFDDDSYPVDSNFFGFVEKLFREHPTAGVLECSIWHPHQPSLIRSTATKEVLSFTGCGHAIRLQAYSECTGYVPRPNAYGLEEADLSLQLFAAGWKILASRDLRVFHNTDLRHHQSAEVNSCAIANRGVLAFLRYPVLLWPWGVLQVAAKVRYCIRAGRWRGLIGGVARIPTDCWNLRRFRKVLPFGPVKTYLSLRRKG